VKDWNSLPQSVVSAGSLASFKSRLTSHAAPWLHSPSVWCRLLIQIQIQIDRHRRNGTKIVVMWKALYMVTVA